MTAQSEVDCTETVGVTTYRALACQLRHRFLSDPHVCPIIGVDGLSGSGKSHFAQILARHLGGTVINTDDLVPGWDGLRASIDLLEQWILAPVSQGRAASWQRFDWELMRAAEWNEIAPTPVLIVDGCGVGHRQLSPFLSYLVWVNAPESLRDDRLRSRSDWEMYQPFVKSWAEQERILRAGDDVASRANLVVEAGERHKGVDRRRAFIHRVPTS
ncbi:MAG: hypothetical protein ABSC34_09470 [Acidimicrobiales bacterium]|jgi:hypothetical protein